MKSNQLRNKQFLYLAIILFLTSCTKEEGAKAEAFFLNLVSIFGLGAVLMAIGLAVVFATLSKGSEYHSLFKVFSILSLIGGAVVLLFWTMIITTDYLKSDAYRFGEGVFFIFFSYLCAVVTFCAGAIYAYKNLAKKLE